MPAVDRLLETVAHTPGWELLPVSEGGWDPEALPAVPEDLAELRRRCGGVLTPAGLAVGRDVRHAQTSILGERHPDDRSFSWFVIAEADAASTSERVVIDLDQQRLGRCYDGFWDRFGVAGSMPVVARSFSDLLQRLLEAEGAAYWSDAPPALGDAYD